MLKRKPVARPGVSRLRIAPTARTRCRVCDQRVEKGACCLETCAFVLRGTSFGFVTHVGCLTPDQARDLLRSTQFPEREAFRA